MATPLAGAVLALYAAAVFAVGLWAQKRAAWMARRGALVTALSIGVYCTTWTFYGAVGTAARSGWDYLPIYLGPILAFTVGYPLIKRVVALGKSHGALSLSDLLSRRFGRSSRLAALVTMTLVAVTIPYIALQLIAVASTYAYVTGSAERPSPPLIIAMTIILAAVGLLLG
ncbi:MAG: hybrid sensor histidine kinase/response regulator, partial [Pseudomonadota bacterium]